MPSINLSKIAKTVEDYMLDTVTIRRRGHETTVDPDSLRVVESSVVVFSGPAFIGPMGNPVVTTVGAVPTTRQLYEIGIPTSAPEIQPNDTCVVSVSHDPTLLGVTIIIDGAIPSTFFTHRRLQAHLDVVNDG